MSRAAKGLGLALLAGVTLTAGLAAQERGRAFGGFEYRSMSFSQGLDTDTRGVSEMVVPMGFVLPLSQRLTVDVGVRYASASRKADVRDTSGAVVGSATTAISGLTDTQARAVFTVRPDVLVFTVTANLPTGKSTLDGAQLATAGAIAHDLIPYPVSSFGSGPNVTTGLAFAMPLGGWALGVGGSYRLSGPYRLLTNVSDTTGLAQADYRAGAEMRVRVGLDRLVGQGRVALGITYSSFARDELGEQQVLHPGKRWITQASWSFPVGRMGLALYAWDLYRAAGNEVQTNQSTESQNLFAAGAAASITMGRNQLRPGIEYRRHWVGEPGLASAGALLSGSLRYVMPLGDRYVLLPSLRYDAGSVVNSLDENIGFSGLSAGVTLRVNW